MRRHCDGRDPNLVMHVDSASGDRLADIHSVHFTTFGVDSKQCVDKPCDCGLVFDDVRRSTIYPHTAI